MGSMMLFPLSDPSPSSSMILVALDPQKPLPYEFRQERKHHNIFFNAADILTKYEKEQLSLDNIVIHDFNLHSEKIDKIDMHQYIRWIEYNRRFKTELSFLQYHHLEKDVAGAIVDSHTLERGSGLNALEFLRNFDSNQFLAASDALIVTGETQSNINDFVIAVHL
jgi:hypothetical protein